MPDISIEVLSERVDQILRGQLKQEEGIVKMVSSIDALQSTMNNMVLNQAIEVQKTRTQILESGIEIKETIREEMQEAVADLRDDMETGYVSKDEYRPVGRARDILVKAVISVVVMAVALAIGINVK